MTGFADSFSQNIDPGIMNALGDDVTFISDAGAVSTIKAVFDADYYQPSMGAGVETAQPVLLCNAADVPNYSQASRVIYHGISYQVANSQPDGTGQVLLILQALQPAAEQVVDSNALTDINGSVMADVNNIILQAAA